MALQRARRIFARLGQIASYAAVGRRWRDAPNLAVVGMARHHPFSEQDFPTRLLHRLYPMLLVRPAQLNGLRVELDPADISDLVVFDEMFIQRAYDFSAVPFEPDLICDCGAHVGMFTLLSSANFLRSPIVAFEPNPQNARRIRRQIDLNHLQIKLHEAAVSISDGESWFESEYSLGGSLQSSDAARPGWYRVKVVGLPEMIAARHPSRLLLKMDIEGEEVNLMPALLPVLPASCFVFFETHDGEEGWARVASCLQGVGFDVRRTRNNGQWMDGAASRR
jgi:FkbM family methyltransferase